MPSGLGGASIAAGGGSGIFKYKGMNNAPGTLPTGDLVQVGPRIGGLGGPPGLEEQAGRLQLKQMKQQMALQKRIMNMLLGEEGGSGGGFFENLMGGIGGGGGGFDFGMGSVNTPGYAEGTEFGMPITAHGGQPGFREDAPMVGGSQPGFREDAPGAPPLVQHRTPTVAPPSGGSRPYGQGRRESLAQQYADIGRSSLANLEARGLGGTSLTAPTLSGVQRQQSLAMNELDDQLFREQLQARTAERAPLFGILQSLLGGAFGAIS